MPCPFQPSASNIDLYAVLSTCISGYLFVPFSTCYFGIFSTQATKISHKFLFKKKYKHANFVPKAFKKLGQQKVVFWTNRHPWLGLGWSDLHQFNAPTSNVYKGSVPTPNVCNITSNICKGSANTISNVCNITSNICKCSTNVTSNVYIFKCCRWPFSVLSSTNFNVCNITSNVQLITCQLPCQLIPCQLISTMLS